MKAKHPHTEKIKAVLQNKADIVQREHGLNYLMAKWQRFAHTYAEKESLIYEWQNDLDTRRIIDEMVATLSNAKRNKIEAELKVIDAKVIKKTFEINECVWGSKVERDNQYNRHKNWYYYRMNQKVFDSEAGKFTKS